MFWYKITGKTFQVYYGPGISDASHECAGYQWYVGNDAESTLQVTEDGLSLEKKPVVLITRQFSKLKIRRTLRSISPELEALLDSQLDSNIIYRKDWDDADVILEDDPSFVTMRSTLLQLVDVTAMNINIEELLEKCISY